MMHHQQQPPPTTTSPSRDHVGPTLDTVNGYDVIACTACGFVHAMPIPDETTLRAIYASSYYTETKPDYIKNYETDRDWWDLVYGERLSIVEPILERSRLAGEQFVALDVGSGPGGFLRAAALRGWEAIGIEVSKPALSYSRANGHVVFERALLDDDNPAVDGIGDGIFDFVHMSEVLEHLPDPVAALAKIHALLVDGGMTCIVVPNDYNLLQSKMRSVDGRDPWWLAPPHHINYFTIRTLHALVQRCGFRAVDILVTFPLEFFLLADQNYVGNDDVGRQIHGMRKAFEMTMERYELSGVKRQLYRALANHGIGRDIVLYARKAW